MKSPQSGAARGPELAIALDPCRLFFQIAHPELANPYAANQRFVVVRMKRR
jgi:hypothetical protein